MKDVTQVNCPECTELDRRDFVRTVAVGGAALAAGGAAFAPKIAIAGEKGPMPRVVNTVAEELVKELYESLDAAQKKAVVKPWDHPARKSVNPNRALDKTIGAAYTTNQQLLLQRIVRAIASDDKGWHQITRAGTWDASRTFDNTGADIFGDPSKGKFAFLFTGHHLTIRCDADNEDGAAFGGPIYYGHTPNGYHPSNVFAYQTREVMKLFDALDPKQQAKAKARLGEKKPQEGKPSLDRLAKETRPGIQYSELSADQKELVEKVMKTILSPFRQQDGAEVVTLIKAVGGMEKMHFAFYDDEYDGSKTNEKQPWTFWRVLGPGFVWNFRVLPHVHTYVNISSKVG
jgi:hypothetical protein